MVEIGTLSDFDICAFEAKASANENNMILEDDSIVLIANASSGDFRKTRRLIRWLGDYMLEHYIIRLEYNILSNRIYAKNHYKMILTWAREDSSLE